MCEKRNHGEIRATTQAAERNSKRVNLLKPSDLELWLFLGELAELSAEAESLEHGIVRGDGQVGPAGDATVSVDARQGELQQVILSAIAALQTGAGYLMRPWDDVTFLREHGDNIIQVFLAG